MHVHMYPCVHASLSNLNRFQKCLHCRNRKKCTKQGTHFLIYYLKTVLLNVSLFALLDQSVVNHAVDDYWRRHLLASVDAEDGPFEHYLWLLLSK